ncbi:DUF366 family protein [Methanobrevibacter filiformis]|uniref:DUF366 domain-containing protein n=1 Tax=Methanobrevibacter filiformis TaxID=55758 RepID=A0A166C8V2_9EURY|nr:DUF366 family protein [Methanobrevibacter filiformis]KZX12297.1 hypothetical protein MBFIL_11640 [Methanobrevibacter filiformis]
MEIKYKHLDNNFEYDGSQIDPSWAFRKLQLKGSSVISWIGSMNIKSDNLKDFEDVGLEIKSESMIHFIIEHFDTQPANLRLIYHRQRILVMILKELLSDYGIISKREGDDIYIDSKKLTVSIATTSISSMKIHFGINIYSKGTPDDVETIGLFEICNGENSEIFTENNILDFIANVVNSYINELNSIELDISKTNVF